MNHTRSPLPTPNSYPQNRSRETSRRTLHRRSLQNHGHREEKEAEIRRIHYRRGLEQAGLEAGTRKQITGAELRRDTHLSGSGSGGGGREGRGARRAERISSGQGLVSSPSMATHPPRPDQRRGSRRGKVGGWRTSRSLRAGSGWHRRGSPADGVMDDSSKTMSRKNARADDSGPPITAAHERAA
jgi:hypothetical protein